MKYIFEITMEVEVKAHNPEYAKAILFSNLSHIGLYREHIEKDGYSIISTGNNRIRLKRKVTGRV